MANYLRLFFRRIVKDFKQKELLPLKGLFFVHMSTLLVLYPYLTIHMRELGINVEETAIMSAVTPVVGILMPPLAGLIADKIGNFKVMLALFSVFSGLSALLLLTVPIGRATISYSENIVLGLSCNKQNIYFSLPEQSSCTHLNASFEADVKVESCGVICQAYLNENDTRALFRSDYYDLQIHDSEENRTNLVRYTLNPKDSYALTIRNLDINNQRRLKDNENYTIAIRKLSKNTFYFPTQSLYNFTCNTSNDTDNYRCIFGTKNGQGEPVLTNESFKASLNMKDDNEDDLLEDRKMYQLTGIRGVSNQSNGLIDLNGLNRSVNCEMNWHNKNYITILTSLKNERHEEYKNMEFGSCAARCIASSKRSNFCSNPNVMLEFDIKLTFWTYLLVRVFIGIIGGTAYTMFEGAVIAILREHKADYGLQRMYASFGGMISSPLSGLLIDYASEGRGYTDFRPVFYLYAALKVISAVLMLRINLDFKTPAAKVLSDVLSVMNIELITLFVAVFLMGCAWGYIESFLFWLLQDLGGTKSLMGLTITVGGILGIPLLACSGPLIKKVGHANIIFIGFLTYAVRLFGYSIIYNPWLSLIFEALECLTHSLCFTAAITYAARLSTVTTDTTVQGILGGLFYGVGKSTGSLIGGYLIKYLGMRTTFQIFAVVSVFTAFVYLSFYHCFLKKRSIIAKCEKEPNENKETANGKKSEVPVNGDLIVSGPKSVPFEDTLTNLGYEDTEFDLEKEEGHEQQHK